MAGSCGIAASCVAVLHESCLQIFHLTVSKKHCPPVRCHVTYPELEVTVLGCATLALAHAGSGFSAHCVDWEEGSTLANQLLLTT